MLDDITTALARFWPAFFGAVLALKWLNGSWTAKFTMIVGGFGTAIIVGPWLIHLTGIPEPVIYMSTGLFGITIVDGMFRAWNDLALGVLIRDVIRHKLGLPKDD